MLAAWAPRGCRSERSFRCLQSFARQPSGIVECREIAKPAVAQDGCDALARPQLPRERHRAGDVDPRRQAEAQPLLVEQAAADIQPLGVRDPELRVDRRPFARGADTVPPDAFADARPFGFPFAALVIIIAPASLRIGQARNT